MGIYINPTDGKSKEAWLSASADRLAEPPKTVDLASKEVPVCLVDNQIFTAAGVCYDDAELAVFATPDGRQKSWWRVPIAACALGGGLSEREIQFLESRA